VVSESNETYHEGFLSIIEALSYGEDALIDPTFVQESEATKLLQEGEVLGIYRLTEDGVRLVVANQGIRQSILVMIADRNVQVEATITRIATRYQELIPQAIADITSEAQVLQEAELKSLHAQINPHFLYNTLETMRMQCEIDEYYTHGNNLKLLSDLFRYSIRWGNKEAPFIMEWDNLVNYLKIMQLRFGEDISYDLQYEYDMDDVLVPKMLLQPLVENSFGHGFKEMLPPWRLSVHVTKEEENMSIVICDNGTGIEKERLIELQGYLSQETTDSEYRSNQESIGLMNTKQRLRMICGDQSNIEIDSEYGEGTTIVITIPL